MSTISTGNNKLANGAVDSGTTASESPSGLFRGFGRVAALGSLVGLGGIAAASYLSSKEEAPQTNQQIVPLFSGMSRTGSIFVNSLAELVAPTANSIIAAGPKEDSKRISLGMSEEDLVDSAEDLSFAVTEPALVNSITLGPWVAASDKDLSPLIQFNKLTKFSIAGGDNITGSFLDYLRGAPLWQLSLENLPKFNGENLKFISRCDLMEQMTIVNCSINEQALEILSDLDALKLLVLDGTGTSARDIRSRLTNPSLKDVVVRGLESESLDLAELQQWVDAAEERSLTIDYPDGSSTQLLHKSPPRKY
jgi:hypothetical protein